MFSWTRFYPLTITLEYLLENALHRRARKVQFEVRIVIYEISKLAHPDRNNVITSVAYFLRPLLSLHVPAQQNFFSVADGLMLIGHTLTPVSKKSKVLRDFPRLCTVPVDYYIWYPRQMKSPSSTGMSNIVPRPMYASH